ncbi:gamma-aminobutyric acid type B receptor subunit 1-like isoform X2 [Actinia tenebrosa]|nr:gamma-aminobutyric acid type B receptor subunit 1-like isoform X2 [Actinia tenebrosa]
MDFLAVRSTRSKLFLGGMFSHGSHHAIDSLQLVCENALEIVNNRTDILPEYQLYLLPNDTKCDEAYGTQVLFEYILRRPPIIMLFGAGCSSVTRSVAQTAWQWNLVQVSYASTSSELSNHDRYPLLYRVVAPQSTYNAASLKFFELYKWNRIATLVQNEREFNEMMAELHQELAKQNFTIVASESFTTDSKSEIRALKEKDARIIAGMFHEDKARQVFCEAYKLGMYGAKYVWLLLDWYDNHKWWLKNDQQVDCTQDQLTRATSGYFSFEHLNPVTNGKPGISGLTIQDIRNIFSTSNPYAPFAFDAVWVMALSLHKAAEKLHLENMTLDSFTYENKEIAKIIRTSVQDMSFQGVTGHIKFNKQGDRVGPVRLKQLQNGVHLTVAVYEPSIKSITKNNTSKVMWQGSGPPSDTPHIAYQTEYIAWSLFWFIITVTSCGILLSLLFLAFNIKYRHNSYIKSSSPCLNNVIIVGALLIYASVFSILLDSRVLSGKLLPYMCTITVFLLGIGYSLMFGAMFTKTWRVHQVLNKAYSKQKMFGCSELIGLVLILLVIDVIVFSLWTALDPFTLNMKTTTRKVHSHSSEAIFFQYECCHSQSMTTWYYVIFGYKGFMLLVGCFVAWETRKVKVKSLNDSHFICTSIFTIVFAVFIGVPLTFLIPDHRDAHVTVLALCLILPTTISLCLIFVPKIGKMKKHPEEFLQLKSLTVMRAAKEYSNRSAQRSSNDALNATIQRLQVDLAKVKKELRDQKALNATVRPVDKNRFDVDSVDNSVDNTPRCTRKPLAIRSNTCFNIKEDSKSHQTNQHRRCNTFSEAYLPNGHMTHDSHVEDLKVENESLRHRLRQSKIIEAGKMCKVLYENAELNRKIVELSMKQTPSSENDAVSRLMKENNELKRQLGEVSILNSVWCDVTPKLKRKGTTENKHKKDLKELQHLLTVDLGGGRASSFGASHSRRPPTIGLSQSSLNLLDPKESHREVIGESQENEKKAEDNDKDVFASDKKLNSETKWVEVNGDEAKPIDQHDEDRVNDEQMPFKEEVKIELDHNSNIRQENELSKPTFPSDEPSLLCADNKGFEDEESAIPETKTDHTDDATDMFVPDKTQEVERKPVKQFDKIWAANENSNTRELLRKGKVRLRSQTTYSTYDDDEDDYRLRRTLSADCNPRSKQNNDPRSLSPNRTRTVIGSDNSDSEVDSAQLSPQDYTKVGGGESTGSEECSIERKRKSKRDKKTKIEKVEKTFFV